MTVPTFDELRVEMDGPVAVLTIARPPANYFDRPLITAIADTLDGLATDGTTRAAVLASEGKHFCAGANFGTTAEGDVRAILRGGYRRSWHRNGTVTYARYQTNVVPLDTASLARTVRCQVCGTGVRKGGRR